MYWFSCDTYKIWVGCQLYFWFHFFSFINFVIVLIYYFIDLFAMKCFIVSQFKLEYFVESAIASFIRVYKRHVVVFWDFLHVCGIGKQPFDGSSVIVLRDFTMCTNIGINKILYTTSHFSLCFKVIWWIQKIK